MMKGNFRKMAIQSGCFLLFFLLVTPGWSQSPATLSGIVTNGLTGAPIIGAKISFDNNSTWSVAGGFYYLSITSGATLPVVCSKPGYESFSSAPMTFQPAFAYTLNLSILESRNPPGTTTAVLNTSGSIPFVPVQWQIPHGNYDLLYDDGIPDDFTVWAVQGNQDAVRFTPLAYPAIVTGGMIHLGSASNYPAGSYPLVPFQVSVYDASGPGGTPGTVISGPQVVIPTALGWLEFSFTNPPVVNTGNFYIVMTQGGNAPNAAGIAIDQTNPQFRSYSRFATGNGNWMPAAGNFMIRALVEGSGGPSYLNYSPANVLGYNTWRLKQGEELNVAAWTPLRSTTLTHISDSSWSSLPCGPYRWGVQALYPGNRQSEVTFSNILGKCWTNSVTVHVTLSCDSASVSGTQVTMKNLVYPDTLYSHPVNATGDVFFPHCWKGSYEIKVTRFGYTTSIQNLSLDADTLLKVFLLQEKTPASNLAVNGNSLMASWDKPMMHTELFRETWESGNFTTNDWSIEGGTNWIVSANLGNPQPSAMFVWSPPAINYEQSLVSRTIAGINAPVMKLKYDIYLDNSGTTTLNQMAVELWDGVTWHQLKTYANSVGDIHWTNQELDISAYTNILFKIRFMAYGADSYDINNWNIDNIIVYASELPLVSGNCLLGYDFYLDNILCGFTPDTTYSIPPNLVHYGGTSQACVTAVYGSGSSFEICVPFTSRFLDPPVNLAGTGIDNAAFISWNKPQSLKKSGAAVPPGLTGYNIYRDGALLQTVSNPDTISYYDHNLFPGTYSYSVSALYDLSLYGFPGMNGESVPAGPVDVNIIYGFPLPFYEPWTAANFNANSWTFSPEQGNWDISTGDGNPAPCVAFSATPARTDYTYAMESPVINATGISCSRLWLDYDTRLQDFAGNSSEKLLVELFNNNVWNILASETNSGDHGWTAHHIDITSVRGKAFRIRFRASGANSENIVSWEVDNINAYSVCKPAKNLAGDAAGFDVRLTWSPPVCEEGHPLNEGFEEADFPPFDWSQRITNPSATWFHSDINSPIGVHSGSWAARVSSDYNHQDEWLIASDVEISGNLVFWSFGYQGSVHHDHYYVKLSRDHGVTWEILMDLSAMPPYPGVSGYNQWNEPYTIDLSGFLGQVVDLAWQVVDGDGQGAWYTWAIDDCKVGAGTLMNLRMAGSSGEYDVYRQDAGAGNYNKINPDPVSDTTLVDPSLPPTSYKYYVTSVSENCQLHTSSDTITVDVVTGIPAPDYGAHLRVYPNPAKDLVLMTSDSGISSVRMLDWLGRPVYFSDRIDRTNYEIDLRALPAGVYILQTIMHNGLVNTKVVIEH